MHDENEQRRMRCTKAMAMHGDAVYRLAFARCRNKADAEDIFQTTFLRYFAINRSFNDAEHEKAWLLRVCVNACKDLQKSAWRTKVGAIPEGFDAPDKSITEVSPREEVIGRAMRALSPDQRTVVHLHYFEGMPTSEIAQVLGMRSATVRSHLHRARIAMRNALEDAGFARGATSTGRAEPAPEASPTRGGGCKPKRAAERPSHFNNAAPEQGGPR